MDGVTHLPRDWQSQVDSAHLAAGGEGAVAHLGAGPQLQRMRFTSPSAVSCITCDSPATADVLVAHLKKHYGDNIECIIATTISAVEIR